MADEQTTQQQNESTTPKDLTYPEVQPGVVVRVHELITETNSKGEEKVRTQIFEGTVLQRKHGKGINATITVRKVSNGIGVEKIYPLNAPVVKDIEVVKKYRVRRAKLSYIRGSFKKLKEIKA